MPETAARLLRLLVADHMRLLYFAKAFWDQRWWRYVSFIKFWVRRSWCRQLFCSFLGGAIL